MAKTDPVGLPAVVLDPIALAPDPAAGVDLAHEMLSSINPWGSFFPELSVDLRCLLKLGVHRGGAYRVIDALREGREYWPAPYGLLDPVEKLSGSDPRFRMLCGANPLNTDLARGFGPARRLLDRTDCGMFAGIGCDMSLSDRVHAAYIRLVEATTAGHWSSHRSSTQSGLASFTPVTRTVATAAQGGLR